MFGTYIMPLKGTSDRGKTGLLNITRLRPRSTKRCHALASFVSDSFNGSRGALQLSAPSWIRAQDLNAKRPQRALNDQYRQAEANCAFKIIFICC
ncbi:hypothetical protein FKM82_029600 [Ascaphus truei]